MREEPHSKMAQDPGFWPPQRGQTQRAGPPGLLTDLSWAWSENPRAPGRCSPGYPVVRTALVNVSLPPWASHWPRLTCLKHRAQAIWSSWVYPGLYGKPPFTSSLPLQLPFLRGDHPSTWLETAKEVLKGKTLALECGEHAGVGWSLPSLMLTGLALPPMPLGLTLDR